jgi:hypothetical protein
MRRRTPKERETSARFRLRELEPLGLELRRQGRRWATDHLALLRGARPVLPDFLDDRQQEVWEPLYAVAGLAGGAWSARIARAARLLSGGSNTGTPGVEVLADLRTVLETREWMLSVDAAAALNALEGRPWADANHGKGLTPNRLARLVAPFGVTPTNLRVGDKVQKGYRTEAFADAFARYLGDPVHTTATPLQPVPRLDEVASGQPLHEEGVAVADSTENPGGTGDVAVLRLPGTGGPGDEADEPPHTPEDVEGRPATLADLAELFDLEPLDRQAAQLLAAALDPDEAARVAMREGA